jgi:hypothetical protein
MEIQIIEADKDLLSKWDAIVEESPHGTIFHMLDWLKTVEKNTTSKLYLLAGLKGEEITGIFPLFRQNFMHSLLKAALSPHGSSFVPYLGPIFLGYNEYKQDKRESILKDFQTATNDFYTKQLNPNYISIICAPGFEDMRCYQWSGHSVTPCYTYMKNIVDIESTWNDLKKQLRKNIRNAENKGVTVKEGDRKDVDFIYSSVSQRLEDQQLFLGMPKEYFYNLYDVFYPRNLRIFLAEYAGERVGGIIILCFKGKVSVWFGAAQPELSGFYPNDLLHWSIIQWANKEGFKEFEIIGANSPSISFFKSRYNLNLELYFSVTKYSSRLVKYAKSAYVKALLPVMNGLHLR